MMAAAKAAGRLVLALLGLAFVSVTGLALAFAVGWIGDPLRLGRDLAGRTPAPCQSDVGDSPALVVAVADFAGETGEAAADSVFSSLQAAQSRLDSPASDEVLICRWSGRPLHDPLRDETAGVALKTAAERARSGAAKLDADIVMWGDPVMVEDGWGRVWLSLAGPGGEGVWRSAPLVRDADAGRILLALAAFEAQRTHGANFWPVVTRPVIRAGAEASLTGAPPAARRELMTLYAAAAYSAAR